MTSHDLDDISASLTVPWDDAREDRVLTNALGSIADRSRRRRHAWGAALGAAILLIIWQGYRGVSGGTVENQSSGAAAVRTTSPRNGRSPNDQSRPRDSLPEIGATPSAADGGVRGTTGGVAGTGGFNTDRQRGSTGLGGNAGTS